MEALREQVLVDADLLEALLENTYELIGEWSWMAGTSRGEVTLGRLRGEAAQARELLESNPVVVWKATNGNESCHFGNEGQAAAFARDRGTVERIELMPPPTLDVVR